MCQQQQVRVGGIGHQRIDRVPDGHPQTAVGNAFQPFAATGYAVIQPGDQRTGHISGITQGIRNGVVTQFLGHQGPGHIVHAQATESFGDRQCGQALLGDLVTQIRGATDIGFPDFTEHFGGRFGHQKTADGLAKRDLVFGKGKVHARPHFGRPSMRSAIMLRWISLVPA